MVARRQEAAAPRTRPCEAKRAEAVGAPVDQVAELHDARTIAPVERVEQGRERIGHAMDVAHDRDRLGQREVVRLPAGGETCRSGLRRASVRTGRRMIWTAPSGTPGRSASGSMEAGRRRATTRRQGAIARVEESEHVPGAQAGHVEMAHVRARGEDRPHRGRPFGSGAPIMEGRSRTMTSARAPTDAVARHRDPAALNAPLPASPGSPHAGAPSGPVGRPPRRHRAAGAGRRRSRSGTRLVRGRPGAAPG